MRDELRAYLSENGIETLVHYPIPPHQQAAFRHMNSERYPVTEQIHREVLSLPLNPVLEESEVSRIVEVVNRFSQ
jgi:dTDP-4-amino-4,6-dideoxygalactose transaminase